MAARSPRRRARSVSEASSSISWPVPTSPHRTVIMFTDGGTYARTSRLTHPVSNSQNERALPGQIDDRIIDAAHAELVLAGDAVHVPHHRHLADGVAERLQQHVPAALEAVALGPHRQHRVLSHMSGVTRIDWFQLYANGNIALALATLTPYVPEWALNSSRPKNTVSSPDADVSQAVTIHGWAGTLSSKPGFASRFFPGRARRARRGRRARTRARPGRHGRTAHVRGGSIAFRSCRWEGRGKRMRTGARSIRSGTHAGQDITHAAVAPPASPRRKCLRPHSGLISA